MTESGIRKEESVSQQCLWTTKCDPQSESLLLFVPVLLGAVAVPIPPGLRSKSYQTEAFLAPVVWSHPKNRKTSPAPSLANPRLPLIQTFGIQGRDYGVSTDLGIASKGRSQGDMDEPNPLRTWMNPYSNSG